MDKYVLDKNKEIPVSERKLEPKITIGFANKAPRFIVLGKHCIGLEERTFMNITDYINSQNITDGYTQARLFEYLEAFDDEWWLKYDNIILALIDKIKELEIRLHIE